LNNKTFNLKAKIEATFDGKGQNRKSCIDLGNLESNVLYH